MELEFRNVKTQIITPDQPLDHLHLPLGGGHVQGIYRVDGVSPGGLPRLRQVRRGDGGEVVPQHQLGPVQQQARDPGVALEWG